MRRAVRRPAVAMYLATLITLPAARPSLVAVGASGAQVTDIFLALTYVAVAVEWARGGLRPRPDGVLMAGLLYLAIAGASILAAPEPSLSSALKLTALGGYILLPWLTPHLLRDEQDLRWAVRAWLVGTLIVVAVALGGALAFAFDRDALTSLGCVYGRLPPGPYPRVCIPFRNPNLLANYLTASGPLLAACGLALLRRPWWQIAVAGCVLAAISTLSTGVGGFALAMAIAAWGTARGRGHSLGWGRRAVVAAGVGAAIAAAVVTVGHVVPAGHGHIRVLGHEWNLVRGPRVHTWLSAVGTVAENPFLGVGYGEVVARTPGKELSPWLTGRLDPFADAEPRVAEAHNAWLNVAGQTGLLGLTAFLWLLVQVSRRLSARPLPMPSPVANLPTAVVAGAAGALLFHGFFVGAEEARHVWALLSLGTAAEIVRRTGEGLNPGTRPVSSARHRPSR